MFEQNKYKIPLDNFISNNPNFTRTDLENQLSRLGIYTGATPNRSINRDVLKYLRKNLPEFDKKTTKEIRKTKDEIISDDEFARDDFIDREIEPEVQWRRKLLKTGKTSNPKWKTSTNIEIYTFINSDDGKFNSNLYQELYEGVQEEIPFMSEIDSDGYSDNLVDRYEIETEYEYPSANLIINGKRTTVILKW